MSKRPRIRLRTVPSPAIRLQYLIFPYANFHVAGDGDRFQFASFTIWRDTAENWLQILGAPRPAQHLAMYVGRDGAPLPSMWIATHTGDDRVAPERWHQLSSVLFYSAWCRIPYMSPDRPAAEDFYAEAFVVPEGAPEDSSGHGRWSKYGASFWSSLKIYSSPEASLRGTHLELPRQGTPTSIFYDADAGDLFLALEREFAKSESRLLTALRFLFEASYRSAMRSTYAEDIQNLCTAFEALVDISRKGDSYEQVASRLQQLFAEQAPTAIESACSLKPAPEHPEVLKSLAEWLQRLYDIRNAYTHGKAVTNYLFGERSVWVDAFEVFRLAANRVILNRPERHPDHGSALEKRLMSVRYFDEITSVFRVRGGWMDAEQSADIENLREAIRKGQTLDPQLVESISGLKAVRQSLLNISTVICRTLERRVVPTHHDEQKLLQGLQAAYADSRSDGSLNVDAYIRRVVPLIQFQSPAYPIGKSDIPLYSLIGAMKSLAVVYANFTSPILNSLAAAL